MIRAAAAIAVVTLAAAALARSPDVVRWQDAAAHVGRVITVEGTVASARVAGGACTLEFAPGDATALRVVLMLALFSSPDAPERLYSGRRVQASGRVQRFQGRPEIIIRRADQITVMDEGSSTTSTTTPTPPPPAPVTPPATPPGSPPDTCAQAQDRWQAARRELSARAEDAAGCLRAQALRCRNERDAVGAALAALATREAEADAACR